MATNKKADSTQPQSGTTSSAASTNGAVPVPAAAPQTAATASTSSATAATSQSRYEDYQIMPQSPWPPPVFVKKNVTPQERYYLEYRWNSQWRFFDKKATENKTKYFFWQLIVVIGSVTVPVLVSFNSALLARLVPFAWFTDAIASDIVDFVTVVISLSVAIAAAVEGLNKYGELWGSYRQAAEELQAEKSFYDVSAGRYLNNPDAFTRFVERCEEIIAQQHGRFISSVEKQLQQTGERTEEIPGMHPDDDKEDAPAVVAEIG